MLFNSSAKYFGIAICAFITLFITTPSLADTIHVPCRDEMIETIQDGIDAAQDGDTVIVAADTYTGDGNSAISFNGKAITVKCAKGPDKCIIDLQGHGRGFNFNHSETSAAVLDGFTIINGSESSGSGISIQGASPTICNCIFSNNQAGSGGAIYLFQSNSIIKNCLISGNLSIENGGGIYIIGNSNVQLIDNEIVNNSAGILGGGICVNGSTVNISGGTFNGNGSDFGAGFAATRGSTINVNGVTLANNIADFFGGAILTEQSQTLLIFCIFLNNIAGVGGGACATSTQSEIIALFGMFDDNVAGTTEENGGGGDGGAMFNLGVPATIIGCTFEGNTANRGGAIYNSSCNMQSTNCLFFENTATDLGGAIYNLASQPQFKLATMWGNSATTSGGAFFNSVTVLNISNSILRNDSPSEIVNVVGSTTTVTYSNVQGGWAGAGNINQNPMFVDPNNGDFNLSPGSPCIDAGNNAAVPGKIKTDLADNLRFVDDPDTKDTGSGAPPLVDMGALEFQVISQCPWDLDSSGFVGTSDLLALLAQWGTAGSADFDGNGVVGTSDLLALLANWGLCP